MVVKVSLEDMRVAGEVVESVDREQEKAEKVVEGGRGGDEKDEDGVEQAANINCR